MRKHKVAVLPGDGIGPEVVNAAVRVLEEAEALGGFELELVYGAGGLNAVPEYGTNMPQETLDMLATTEACLKGPMTTLHDPDSPTSATLAIRKAFELYANVRPCFTLPNVPSLKPGIDMVVVRENTEGMYSGIEFEVGEGAAVALRVITERASERVARHAFELAEARRRHLTYVHKANILRLTDGLFNRTVRQVAEEFPRVEVDDYHIDAMTAQLIKRPEAFDVIVTTNLFGDIISDEAAQLVGGLGVTAGQNVGGDYAMFEPVHGSAPKYAGQNKVNPMAEIFAVKMMLEYLGERDAAELVDSAVRRVLEEGKALTYDLGGSSGTAEVAAEIVSKIREG